MRPQSNGLALVQRLVGEITTEQLRHIESVVSERIGVFVPVTGACGYATTPQHVHPAYSLIVLFDDRCRVRIDGRVIGGRAGWVYAFSPEVRHEELAGDEAPRYAAVMVEPGFFRAVARTYPTFDGAELRGLAAPSSPALVACVRRLVAEHGSGLPGSAELIAAREVELVHLALRDLGGMNRPRLGRGAPQDPLLGDRLRVGAALRYAHAHFHQHISVSDLAQAAHLSLAHFSREWRRETGVSPMEYVTQLRLDAARRRLISGDEPLTTIAIECGFGSSSYFSYCFSRRFGIPPSQYRSRGLPPMHDPASE